MWALRIASSAQFTRERVPPIVSPRGAVHASCAGKGRGFDPPRRHQADARHGRTVGRLRNARSSELLRVASVAARASSARYHAACRGRLCDPDSEEVRVGHYSRPHATMTAAEATGVIMHADDPRGYEVLIPRKIPPQDLRRTRQVPQVVRWRYWPDARGHEPCGCEVCQRGTCQAAQFRDRD